MTALGRRRRPFRQTPRGPAPALEDCPLVALSEATGNRRPRQVDNGVDPVQEPSVGAVRVPSALLRARRGAAHQPDDAVAAGGQERGQGRTDQPRAPGHGHGQGAARHDLPRA